MPSSRFTSPHVSRSAATRIPRASASCSEACVLLSCWPSDLVFDFTNDMEERVLLLLCLAVLLQRMTRFSNVGHIFGLLGLWTVALSLPRRRLILIYQKDCVAPGNAAVCNGSVLPVRNQALHMEANGNGSGNMFTFCRILPLKTSILLPTAGSVKCSLSLSMTSMTWIKANVQRKDRRKEFICTARTPCQRASPSCRPRMARSALCPLDRQAAPSPP